MRERKSKTHPHLHVRLSDEDNRFLIAAQEEGGVSKTDVVVALFQLGKALGPTAILAAARHQEREVKKAGRRTKLQSMPAAEECAS